MPVEVRLIGEDTAVRTVVAALASAADCGPASYRPARSGGTRAYLALTVAGDRPPTADDTAREVYTDLARAALADAETLTRADSKTTPTDLAAMLGRLMQTVRFLLQVVDGGGQP